MAYRVVLAPAAMRQLDRLRTGTLLALRGVILALADDPRPIMSRKLARSDLRRIRLRVDGMPWRVIYQIRDADQLIVVTRVVRRSEGTYRRL